VACPIRQASLHLQRPAPILSSQPRLPRRHPSPSLPDVALVPPRLSPAALSRRHCLPLLLPRLRRLPGGAARTTDGGRGQARTSSAVSPSRRPWPAPTGEHRVARVVGPCRRDAPCVGRIRGRREISYKTCGVIKERSFPKATCCRI
jgi:hypothetical protein